MKQKLRLGDCYALAKHKLKQRYIRYLSLLAVVTSMCLYAVKQASAQQAEPAATAVIDTATSVRDTLALEEVQVNTGYQRIPKERATGSFVFVDSTMLNRTFSTDILSRLEGIVGGLRFDRDVNYPDDKGLVLRSPGTMLASKQPLVILDNFEYQGNINNINPNDIANITILKDAAAASIWGAKAGNGVIVITTKNGRYEQPTRINFSSGIAYRDRRDLYAVPSISSSDYIDLEIDLFSKGHYNWELANINRPAVSPVVWILERERLGVISESEATNQIDELRSIDTRDDLSKYMHRAQLSQQYALTFSGGGSNSRYYTAVGWDETQQDLVGNKSNRLTMTFNNTIGLLEKKLELETGLFYVYSKADENGISLIPDFNYPYGRLVSDDGAALDVARYNQAFLDTVGGGQLLDWSYKPIEEIETLDNTTTVTDLKVNAALNYRPTQWIRATLRYQYSTGRTTGRNHYPLGSYYARDLINRFSYVTNNGNVEHRLPLGGILDLRNQGLTGHRGRTNIEFSPQWGRHQLQAILGAELSDDTHKVNQQRYYGYDEKHPAPVDVDAVNYYTSIVTGLPERIDDNQALRHLTNRFVSFYASGSYGLESKYWVTASIRRDGSNLFGVRVNQKWSPFWSIGVRWDLHKEPPFAKNEWLTSLTIRSTYGTSGNVYPALSALLVAQSSSAGAYGRPSLVIRNPPNPTLSWETVSTWNQALDFALFNGRISGTLEYFRKWSYDLIGPTELAPSSGMVSFQGNTASMLGWGYDATVTSNILTQNLKWTSTVLYSYTTNRVTEYRVTPANNTSYVNDAYIVGKSLESIFAHRFAGLNPENGNPIGYIDGVPSEDYARIVSGINTADLQWVGTSRPKHTGSLLNAFAWKNLSFSFNILFKAGYYFRRPLLTMGDLYSGQYQDRVADYRFRWRQPGDERRTTVPSLVYPVNTSRDNFYSGSQLAFKRADFIRLQDIRLAYRFGGSARPMRTVKSAEVFTTITNLGMIWRANDIGYDPDFGYSSRQPVYAFGFKLTI